MPSSSDTVIRAEHLSKRFMLRHNRAGSIKDAFLAAVDRRRRERVEEFWALRDVSFEVGRGEALALVGRNGSGKSTLLKLIAGIHVPTSGQLSIVRSARLGTMIELGIGFHGDLTAQENVYLNASIYGLSRTDIDEIYPRIVEYSGLANFMDVPIRNFSSGMNMRLGFSVAANLEPDILLIDEVFAVGDADFQRRCLTTMEAVRKRGCTVLFVSHAASAVRAICERACLLEAGKLIFDGSVDEGLDRYGQLLEEDDGAALPGASSRPAPDVAPDDRPHRHKMGGAWSELGPWASDFLQRRGLQPQHYVLDLGCGSLPVTMTLLPFMAPGHYWGIDADREAFEDGVNIELRRAGLRPERGHFLISRHYDLSASPHSFEYVVAHSLAHRIPPDDFGRAVAAAVGHLTPEGQLFVAVPEELTGHVAVMTRVAETIGVAIERVDEAGHPRREPVYRICRMSDVTEELEDLRRRHARLEQEAEALRLDAAVTARELLRVIERQRDTFEQTALAAASLATLRTSNTARILAASERLRRRLRRARMSLRGRLQRRGHRRLAVPAAVASASPAVNVAGYISAESGMGEATRCSIRALQLAGLPVALNNVPSLQRTADASFTAFTDANPHPFNLVHLNAENMERVRASARPRVLRRPLHHRVLVLGARGLPARLDSGLRRTSTKSGWRASTAGGASGRTRRFRSSTCRSGCPIRSSKTSAARISACPTSRSCSCTRSTSRARWSERTRSARFGRSGWPVSPTTKPSCCSSSPTATPTAPPCGGFPKRPAG